MGKLLHTTDSWVTHFSISLKISSSYALALVWGGSAVFAYVKDSQLNEQNLFYAQSSQLVIGEFIERWLDKSLILCSEIEVGLFMDIIAGTPLSQVRLV